jgi:hypothetical protein
VGLKSEVIILRLTAIFKGTPFKMLVFGLLEGGG